MHPDSRALSATVSRYLALHLPLLGAGSPVVLATHWHNRVLRCDTGRHGHVYAKVYLGERAVIRFRTEVLAIELVNRLGIVDVPQILASDSETDAGPIIVYSPVAGCPLFELPPRLQDQALVAIRPQLAERVTALHAVEFDRFGLLGDPARAGMSWCEHVQCRAREALSDLVRASLLQPCFLERSVRYLADNSAEYDLPARPVFTHNDLHARNVLVRACEDGDWRLSGVLDWESAGGSHKDWEFASYNSLLAPPHAERPGFFRFYDAVLAFEYWRDAAAAGMVHKIDLATKPFLAYFGASC